MEADMPDLLHNARAHLERLLRRLEIGSSLLKDEVDLRCLSQVDVIGMTTTGLSWRINMLRRLRCKVVICEEAGEVLESHLLAAFLPSVEHAILIGDHLQLRPQIQNFDLSRENPRGGAQYSLDVSLFERLVKPGDSPMGCGLPFSTLYPELKDSSSVEEYPEVAGMRKRLFWLGHRMPEGDASNADAMSTSHWNSFEIDMNTALVNHLVRQGQYKGGDIAVLAPYLGQLHRLRERLSGSFVIALGDRDQNDLSKGGFADDSDEESVVKTPLLHTLRVATVDNFQGEEAKVVVISLVRSSSRSQCGFLRTSNRINVLLSRAQHGMYIIGNSETSTHVPMWAQVIEILDREGNIGEALELKCPRHPDRAITKLAAICAAYIVWHAAMPVRKSVMRTFFTTLFTASNQKPGR
ncbi:hypothetical protein NUU61_004829 [Penicillium alfredii]|uniref:DNA2/NAM7 helicase-like C-terminal domain-containing protein n=1 Tax=Penicillium alfredii TaxID=1506179 RepID=A0A9W9K700_9EURO|nr:uncharacterized protein NUU61_004829 [Penicillium alfredii]KAJ5095473.1 hypothetical protein NUU61_004829 [Penicillium alfredii]